MSQPVIHITDAFVIRLAQKSTDEQKAFFDATPDLNFATITQKCKNLAPLAEQDSKYQQQEDLEDLQIFASMYEVQQKFNTGDDPETVMIEVNAYETQSA